MTTRANDILIDYEGLQGQLGDIVTVLELASVEDGPNTMPMLNTAMYALRSLIVDHRTIAKSYREEANNAK